MPVRVVVLCNLGPPFGGFRLAVQPGVFGLDDPQAFEALEQAVDRAYALLAEHAPSGWAELAERSFPGIVPRLGAREGVIDITGSASDEAPGEVVARACFPFRGWSLGGWAVYDGRHRALNGTWTPFSPDELARVW